MKHRIIVNVAQDEWKRRRKEREHIAPEPAFDDEAESTWLEILDVKLTIDRLGEQQQNLEEG